MVFRGELKPVLTIRSGDEATVDVTAPAVRTWCRTESSFMSRPNSTRFTPGTNGWCPGRYPTGPVAIEGAAPGDVLEVEILDVSLRQDWGYNLIRPRRQSCPTISTKRAF